MAAGGKVFLHRQRKYLASKKFNFFQANMNEKKKKWQFVAAFFHDATLFFTNQEAWRERKKRRAKERTGRFLGATKDVWIIFALAIIGSVAMLIFLFIEARNLRAGTLSKQGELIYNTYLIPILGSFVVNLASIVAIYLLWHEGRDKLRGIEFMKGFERNEKLIDIMLNTKRSSIDQLDILDTSVGHLIFGRRDPAPTEEIKRDPDLLKAHEHKQDILAEEHCTTFETAIKQAIKMGVSVNILLLHPNSIVVRQRAQDIQNMSLEEYRRRMKKAIAVLYSLKHSLTDNAQNLDIKFYDKLPSINVYIFQDYAYVGVFPRDQSADFGNVLRCLSKSQYGIYAAEQFMGLFYEDVGCITMDECMHLIAHIIRKDKSGTTLDQYDLEMLYLAQEHLGQPCPVDFSPKYVATLESHGKIYDDVKDQNFLHLSHKIPHTTPPEQNRKNKLVKSLKEFKETESNKKKYAEVVGKFRERYGVMFNENSNFIFEIEELDELVAPSAPRAIDSTK
jgi:hypothetical protein